MGEIGEIWRFPQTRWEEQLQSAGIEGGRVSRQARGQAALTQQQSRAGLAMDGKPGWGGQGKTAQWDNASSGPAGYPRRAA